ncbi:uncharacterized protein LOC109857240 isoform X2 [Pseudomyrmex gracilis]|uniref:uncharacterized protein LOC109857240 isoform X2 n=1 Tax=Pseudomyrmex gracilis TaxID=219809 RepID=UPI00099591BE|nr:uncharacterized protein LOC109857240 isoform X2 [Pseudomyrmex gracilis]
MLRHVIVFGALCFLVIAEPPIQGIKSTNVIGSADQHTSFSFIRPGLTQTSYAFNGPSSHQSFASSIGNPQLAQRVLPSLAHALAYKHPGLGSVANGYGVVPTFATPATAPLAYQSTIDPATALAYMQQLQQQQHAYSHAFQPNNIYQPQLAQLLAFRQAQLAQAQQLGQLQSEQVSEKAEEQKSQNLLGVAYSSAPSVAHVNVSGNGYKFNF